MLSTDSPIQHLPTLSLVPLKKAPIAYKNQLFLFQVLPVVISTWKLLLVDVLILDILILTALLPPPPIISSSPS